MEQVDIQNCEGIEVSAKHGAHNQHGFVIVGDNIDKNVRPSLQREERRHFHCTISTRMRLKIDLILYPPLTAKVTPESILPSEESFQSLLSDFEVLISR